MKTIEEINQEWAPVVWYVQKKTDTYQVLMAIENDILINAQMSNEEDGKLYAFSIQGTDENVKNFILKRKG